MKVFRCKKFFVINLCILLTSLLVGCSATSGVGEKTIVTNVVDGDTLDVMINNKEERIRLLLVDTPETKHPSKPVQPFGPEASKFTKDTLEGKEVTVELDVSERDKYGRLLAYIWIDGKMFNEMLLEKGLARVAYVYAPNTKYVDQFYEIQKKAQKQGIGIWSIENYATEEGFIEEKASIKKEPSTPTKNGDCVIKGNINSKGEKIYHTPSSRSYNQTKPEIWFCTEEEAIAAGFRAPVR
ncbi:thermonuclease family protein [Schinkia azotoformans]|uniref:Thermonuclease n=1 Tax=Schinkia azotoformans LMG 9581 TaxID=1131731 RepID=K6DKI7_SCHAZ|nr:thermonuclease family protein [Schinkia azotoformans]EKN68653.1 thermonuclease [Schinkia azotoformans LMG 9581]MEC1640723.1 thermonuclease family protein [Schinkia azotoformans]MEC1945689.1 thermonuclease family protein [Schinkia azotoformans]MED4353673.1 thermonuclease family protein [Schinkia azotoformans]